MRFEARARYTRTGPDGESRAEARFVQVLLPNGTFEDRVDDDPDFLTILNQPFAVRLDAATLRDLRALARPRAILRDFAARRGGGSAGIFAARDRRPDRRAADGCGEFRSGGRHDRTAARLSPDAGLRKHAYGRLRVLRARWRDAPGLKRHIVAEGTAGAKPFRGLDPRANHVYSLDTSALKRSDQLHLQRVPERPLPQLRERRECKVILMAVDQHLDAAFDAARLLHVLRQLLLEVRVRIA